MKSRRIKLAVAVKIKQSCRNYSSGTGIETAKSLAKHTGTHIFTYLRTDEKRRREAMNKREGKELKVVLTKLYNQTRNGNIELSVFLKKTVNLIRNG